MTVDYGLVARLEGMELAMSRRSLAVWARLRPDAGARELEVAGGSALFFGSGSPLSQALSIGMQGPVDASELDRLEAFYHENGTGVTISLCPYAEPGLVEQLGRRGYRISHFENTLWRRLPAVEVPPARFEGAVAPAGTGDQDAFVQTLLNGFFANETIAPEMRQLFEAIFTAEGSAAWLARFAGEAAGGAMMMTAGPTALLAGDATVPAHRARGAQSALIQARLEEAQACGCDLAMACTMPGTSSERNYQRAGFSVAYTKAMLQKDWS